MSGLMIGFGVFIVALIVFLYYTGLLFPAKTSTLQHGNITSSITVQQPCTFKNFRFITIQYGAWKVRVKPFILKSNGVPISLIPELTITEPLFSKPTVYGERVLTLQMINDIRLGNKLPAWNGELKQGDVLSFGFSVSDVSQFFGTRFNEDGTLWVKMDTVLKSV